MLCSLSSLLIFYAGKALRSRLAEWDWRILGTTRAWPKTRWARITPPATSTSKAVSTEPFFLLDWFKCYWGYGLFLKHLFCSDRYVLALWVKSINTEALRFCERPAWGLLLSTFASQSIDHWRSKDARYSIRTLSCATEKWPEYRPVGNVGWQDKNVDLKLCQVLCKPNRHWRWMSK